jgi:hypothetical protein
LGADGGGAADPWLFSGDLLAALLPPSNPLERASAADLLPAEDAAGALLTGGLPRADLLPRKGAEAAPVAALLADDGAPAAGGAGRGGAPLADLFLDPAAVFRRRPASGQGTPPTAAGEFRSRAVPAWLSALLLSAALPFGCGLVLGALRKRGDRRRGRDRARRAAPAPARP